MPLKTWAWPSLRGNLFSWLAAAARERAPCWSWSEGRFPRTRARFCWMTSISPVFSAPGRCGWPAPSGWSASRACWSASAPLWKTWWWPPGPAGCSARARPRRRRRWGWWVCPGWPSATRPSCRLARFAGWSWPEPWSAVRPFCCWMSWPPIWMTTLSGTLCTCSTSWTAGAPPSLWRPTPVSLWISCAGGW